jgi:hypothetical protein
LPCVLRRIHDRQADGALATLATRAAHHVPLDNKLAIARLTDELREAGASAAMKTLKVEYPRLCG